MLKYIVITWFTLSISVHCLFAQEDLNDKSYVPSARMLAYKTFMEEFSKQTGFFFSYGDEVVAENNAIYFKKQRYGFNEALQYAFFSSDIDFMIHKNVVILSKAQRHTLKGRLLDNSDGTPIAFATVKVEGMNNGAVTDENGNYDLNLKDGNYELQYLSFGYYPLYENVQLRNGDINKDVELTPIILQLDTVFLDSKIRIKDISNIDALMKVNYNSFNAGINDVFLPGTLTLNNGEVKKGEALFGDGFIKRVMFFEDTKRRPVCYKVDSLQCFVYDRPSYFTTTYVSLAGGIYFATTDLPVFDFKLKKTDPSGHTRFGLFPKVRTADSLLTIKLKKTDSSGQSRIGIFPDIKSLHSPSDTAYYSYRAAHSANNRNNLKPHFKNFQEYFTRGMGNINPFNVTYESMHIKGKRKKVLLPRVIEGEISLYGDTRTVSSTTSGPYYSPNNITAFHSTFFNTKPLIPSRVGFPTKIRTTRYVRVYYIKKNDSLITVKRRNYRKYFPLLFGDCTELMEFVRDREYLRDFKNMFKLILVYNYLNNSSQSEEGK